MFSQQAFFTYPKDYIQSRGIFSEKNKAIKSSLESYKIEIIQDSNEA